jgi:hypothetical protein
MACQEYILNCGQNEPIRFEFPAVRDAAPIPMKNPPIPILHFLLQPSAFSL